MGLPEVPFSEAAAEEAYTQVMLGAPLASRPGTKFSYSSYCYEVIKSILEDITGETLEQYALRKIFDPLGMTDTHYVLPPEKRERYVTRDEKLKGVGVNKKVPKMTEKNPQWFLRKYSRRKYQDEINVTNCDGGISPFMTEKKGQPRTEDRPPQLIVMQAQNIFEFEISRVVSYVIDQV